MIAYSRLQKRVYRAAFLFLQSSFLYIRTLCIKTFLNKAFVGFLSFDNVQTERSIFEYVKWPLLFYCRPNEIRNCISYEIGFPISFVLNLKSQMILKILSHTRQDILSCLLGNTTKQNKTITKDTWLCWEETILRFSNTLIL